MSLRDQFPILKSNPDLVYLDNASTTQKPQRVIDTLINFYSNHNANVHRGLYPIAEKATALYEDARKTIAKFINAKPEEIIFTSGTTDSINKIAQSLRVSKLISENPKILLTEIEHHSNILPWQRISQNISYISVPTTPTKISEYNHETLKEENVVLSTDLMYGIGLHEYSFSIDSPYDIVAATLVSNVTGSILDVAKLIKKVRFNNDGKDCFTVIDAAQAIGHLPINVKELDVDFLVFSGHKMYGPTGVGIIYAKKEILEKMEPFDVGGGMIREVKRDWATWAPIPEKFEAGTPPIAEAVALAEAVRFIQDIGFENIQNHENELATYLIEKLRQIEGINIYHPTEGIPATGVVSFSIQGVHPHDIAQHLGNNDVCVRAGHHCTQILHREVLEIPASLRISLGVYNTNDDIDRLIKNLQDAIKIFVK